MSEDAPAAVAFAEANLRLAAPKKLPQAIQRLAATYWLAKEYDRLDAFLEAGPDYRPTAANCSGFPDELDSILRSVAPTGRLTTDDGRSGNDARPKAVVLQLALMRGEVEKAEAVLEKIKTGKVAKTYAPLVERLQRGLKASAEKPKQRKRVEKIFTAARRQLADVRESVHERFADWPIQRLEKHLAWTVDALGGYCDPVADILAYMVEQRDYRRVKVHSGTALIAGKRLAHRGEPARALPMFLLCQKLGYLSEEGRFDEDGPNAMVAFNAFEAPIYFTRTVRGRVGSKYLITLVRNRDDIYEIAMEMYDYSLAHCRSKKAAGIAGRHGYEAVAMKNRWRFAVATGHADDILGEMKKTTRHGPTKRIRANAAIELSDYYYQIQAYDKCADITVAYATGKIHGKCSTLGLHRLEQIVEATRDESMVQRLREASKEVLRKGRENLSESELKHVKRRSSYQLDKGE